MINLDMNGPYNLTGAAIDQAVTRTSPGNYVLGYVDIVGTFIVQYVGRADSDVNDRLKQHLGENYEKFAFSYATSPKDAYYTECQNYHEFGESENLDNKIHPDKPNGTNWKCPVCGQ